MREAASISRNRKRKCRTSRPKEAEGSFVMGVSTATSRSPATVSRYSSDSHRAVCQPKARSRVAAPGGSLPLGSVVAGVAGAAGVCSSSDPASDESSDPASSVAVVSPFRPPRSRCSEGVGRFFSFCCLSSEKRTGRRGRTNESKKSSLLVGISDLRSITSPGLMR